MATHAQINANRKNAKKSTGPKTKRGQRAASLNSFKHGFTAHKNVISFEDQAEFDQYKENFLEELAPSTPMESMLAQRIINLSWRLKRSGRIQNQTIDALNAPKKQNPLSKLTDKMLRTHGLLDDENSEKTIDLPLGRLAIKDFSNDRVLERLLMYERRLENSLYKTVLEYQRLNLIKQLGKRNENLKQLNTN